MAKKGKRFQTVRGPALCALGGLILMWAFGLTISASVGLVSSYFAAWDWVFILVLAPLGFFFTALGLIYALRAAQNDK